MSVIRKDGVYEGFPSNSKVGNWETLRFFNDEEAVFSNNSRDLSYDSYEYNDNSIEFGKYSVQDDASILIKTTRRINKIVP